MAELAIVVAGGDAPPSGRAIPAYTSVIAADGGLDHVYALGLPVDLLVGDLDSVSASALARARADGVAIDHHAAAKDETDLALALDHVCARGITRALVLGAGGGRLDHALGNLLLLASERYGEIELDAWIGESTVSVVRLRRRFSLRKGDVVSLFAVGGAAFGVATHGLEYPLRHEMLTPGSSRGISNVVVDGPIMVEVADGVLLAVQSPGPE
ncbi:MAG TPA: thiamine diphosphokinase [Acidimicrobiales bacterium]|nr:thiamine diphosphokinase [Acidimicrobiales bacterium]